jgi:hypothetical protein
VAIKVSFQAMDEPVFIGETGRLCLTSRFDFCRQNACANDQD